MKKQHHQSNLNLFLMSIEFRLRDRLRPPVKILQEAGVQSGMTVLDFGCGPGGFSLAAAQLVGPEGLVYAVDIHPLAIASVRKAADKEGFTSIRTILGDKMVEIPAGQVDKVLLYDVLHDLPEPALILNDLHRLLKPNDVLSVSDHHLKETALLSIITNGGFFHFAEKARRTFQFIKAETNGAAS